jgi:hypothetical protein
MLDLHLEARRIKSIIRVVGVEMKWSAHYIELDIRFFDADEGVEIFGGPRLVKVGKSLVYTFPSEQVLLMDGSIRC